PKNKGTTPACTGVIFLKSIVRRASCNHGESGGFNEVHNRALSTAASDEPLDFDDLLFFALSAFVSAEDMVSELVMVLSFCQRWAVAKQKVLPAATTRISWG